MILVMSWAMSYRLIVWSMMDASPKPYWKLVFLRTPAIDSAFVLGPNQTALYASVSYFLTSSAKNARDSMTEKFDRVTVLPGWKVPSE